MQFTLEFLWWFERVAFFSDDLYKEVLEISGDQQEAFNARSFARAKQGHVSAAEFYHNFGNESWFEPFMNMYLSRYKTAGPPSR